MNSQTPIHITIQNINVCLGTQNLGASEAPPAEAPPGVGRQLSRPGVVVPFALTPVFPANGSTHNVHPVSTSAMGTICAHWREDNGQNIPSDVKALVYPQSHFHAPGLPTTPPTNAVSGDPQNAGVDWHWNNTVSQEIPGADHTSSGVANVLVLWRRDGSTWSLVADRVTFSGVTDTTGACMGSSSSESFAAVQGMIFPAVWMAPVRGFRGAPLGVFNGNWALRQVETAPGYTWCNGGDGQLSPSVKLHCHPAKGWQLALRHRQVRIDYALPWKKNPFGPLRFPAGQAQIDSAGAVPLPAVDVSPV
jgi:hypothetical protein